jgi:hypothetical protein
MKLNRLETHDRFLHFTKQNFQIADCCQDLIRQRPFGEHDFYIFAHARTEDNGVDKRLIWQPRLTKPKAQTNSMLFKAFVGTDLIKVIWIIPQRELWKQYRMGFLNENQRIAESIHDFQFNRQKLEKREPDDLTDDQIDKIYQGLAQQARIKKTFKDMGLIKL